MRIIYLHGFASGPSSQKACYFRERFAEIGVDIEVPDLAEGRFEELTISGQLGVIERIAARQPVSLIGSSMGGYLAALYASRHAEVQKLVLLAPAFGFARRWPESLGSHAMERWRTARVRQVYHYADKCERPLRYGIIEDGQEYEDYPAFTQPALIFHGIHDEVVPAAYSTAFADGRSNVQLELLNAGHEMVDVLGYMWPRVRAFLAP